MAAALGQLGGVADTDDRTAVGGGIRAQAYPVGQQAVQAAQLALLKALAGQQDVHAQRPADPADLQEQIGEARLGGQQLAELVTDDQKARHRRQRLARLAILGVVVTRDIVALLAQQLLPAYQLAAQRLLHSVDQRQLVGEVGDDGAGMGQHVE